MTHPDRAALEAAVAAGKEAEALLAKMDAELDWEAWRPALRAYYMVAAETDLDLCSDPLDSADKENIQAIRAALPLAPLSRVPAAAWPGDDWLEGEAVDVANETKHPYKAALEMARRLCAHMTGKPEGGEA